MIQLAALRSVVPDERPTVFDLRDRFDLSAAELVVFHRIYGLDRVPVWHGTVPELVQAVLTGLLADPRVDAGSVRYVIHTHTGTQQVLPGDAALGRVCERVGLAGAQALGMTINNCASVLSAIALVDRLLANEPPGSTAIVVSADVAFTPILQSIPGSTVSGDAAVACLFSRSDGPGDRVLGSRIDVYGKHAAGTWQTPDDAAEFEANYLGRLARTMTGVLDDCGLTWADIRVVMPHNVNVLSWRRVAAHLGIPAEMIYLDQVPHIAHCFGADIFLNFLAAREHGLCAPGDRILLATVGLGGAFGACVLECGEAA